MKKKNKYTGSPIPKDSRSLEIMKDGVHAGYFIFVGNCPIPPDFYHVLLNGFSSKRTLENVCYSYGIAVYWFEPKNK